MKISCFFIVFVCAVGHLAEAAGAKTEKEFLEAIRAGMKANSAAKIEALKYQEGLSPAEKAEQLKEEAEELKSNTGTLTDVSLAPWPEDMDAKGMVANGQRIGLTHAPTGVVSVTFKDGANSGTTMSPYAIIDGKYYLLATKITDLGWTGPKDRQLSLNVSGSAKVQIAIKYNASGVPLTSRESYHSQMMLGQHFDEVIVTCEDPNADLTLTLKEGDQEVFKSAPLKGAGKIEYQRKP